MSIIRHMICLAQWAFRRESFWFLNGFQDFHWFPLGFSLYISVLETWRSFYVCRTLFQKKKKNKKSSAHEFSVVFTSLIPQVSVFSKQSGNISQMSASAFGFGPERCWAPLISIDSKWEQRQHRILQFLAFNWKWMHCFWCWVLRGPFLFIESIITWFIKSSTVLL